MATKNNRKKKIINYRQMLVAQIWEAAPDTTQEEIARQLATDYDIKVTQRTISNDLNALKKSHWQRSHKAMEAIKNSLLDEYQTLYNEAFNAWLDSKEDKETQIQESVEASKGDIEGDEGGNNRVKAQFRTEGQSGNPALLGQAQAALKAIRDMFGLDMPTNTNVSLSWQDKLPDGYGIQDVKQQLIDVMRYVTKHPHD